MPSRYQEILKTQRLNQDTARAGLAWEIGEEDRVLNMIYEGKSFEYVAKDLQRTEGSIRTRLYSVLCKQIDVGEETEQTVYDKYKVKSEELEEFRMKKKKRDEKFQDRIKNRGTKKLNKNTSYDIGTNSLTGHILDIKRDLYAIKQHFKIN